MQAKRFFLVCTLCMVAVWCFRWATKEEMSVEGISTVHKVDRWTGQAWMETYTIANAYEEPLIEREPSESDFEADNELRSLESTYSQEQNRNDQLQQTITKYKPDAESYLKLGKEIRDVLMEPFHNNEENARWYPPLGNCFSPWETTGLYGEDKMPQKVVEGYHFYCQAKDDLAVSDERLATQMEDVLNKKAALDEESRLATESLATTKAWEKRKLYMRVWQGTFSIFCLLTMGGFLKPLFRKR